MPNSNPFFHRGPVHDRAYFFGRQQEMGQILSLLGNGQSIALIGQRRLGKTSLLFHLTEPTVFTRHGLNSTESLFVYIDCGRLSTLDPASLYQVILEEMGDKLAERGPQPPELEALAQPPTYRIFERALRGITRQGWKPILILDEFERLSQNPQLDPHFFSGLRALTVTYPLALVTASKQPLLELTYADASTLSSPFFNIFASIRLGLFSTNEAQTLLTGLAAKGGLTFPQSLVDFLLDLAGPHPLLLQIAGFYAFELQQTRRTTLTEADYAELRENFYTSVEEHFSYYWHNLSVTEQRVLATLSASQRSQPVPVRRLVQAGLIVRRDQNYDYLSSAFRAFVQTQPLPGLLQAGPLTIDESQHQAWLYDLPLSLTPSQYTLLTYLVERAGQVITNEALEQVVWGEQYIEDPERLKWIIKGVRQALGTEAVRLENVRGVGYLWQGGPS